MLKYFVAAIILMNNSLFPEQETAMLLTDILVWISTAITVISGIDYIVKNREIFKDK